MTTAMIHAASHGMRRVCRAALCAMAVAALASIAPAGAGAAAKTSHTSTNLLGISIPASARVHGTTTTPATAAPASTPTQAATAPTASTPANGAQPGTVVPTTSVPTTTVPPSTGAPGSTATTPTTVPGSPSTSSSTTVVGVAHKPAPKSTRLSTLALALAILGALLALGCIVWVLGRWLALEPRWTVSLMHSLREASYRGSATWAEFSDWARIGR